MRALLLVLLASGAFAAAPEPRPRPVGNFRLLDQNGVSHELYRYSDAKAIVVIAHGLGCGIVKDSLSAITELNARFAPKGVVFLLLNANLQDSREEIAAEAERTGFVLPILRDETQGAMRALGITRTAEAVVLDGRKRTVLYRGPISDQFGYGVRKSRAASNSLADALDARLAGKKIPEAKSDVLGCLITPRPAKKLTYVKDVAPILERRCLSCHDGGYGMAWHMKDYRQVAGWTAMTHEVLMTRRMPPWDVDPAYGKFSNDVSMTEEERAVLLEWIESGAERGEGADPLATRRAPKRPDWPAGPPDLVLKMKNVQSIPASGESSIRHIPLAGPLKEDLPVREIAVRVGNRAVTHHAWIFVSADRIQEHEGAPYYSPLEAVTSWTPGMQTWPMPPGSALIFPAGAYVNVQMHYIPSGRPETDDTEIGLYYYRGKKAPLSIDNRSVMNQEIVIPPGEKDYRAKAETIFERDAMITAFYVHLHYRGKSMRFTAHYPDGRREILLSVPSFDYNWQRCYQLAEPKRVPAGTKVVVDSSFDNSRQNPFNPDPTATVGWGTEVYEEMLYSVIYNYEL